MMDKVSEAIQFATIAHSGMCRKRDKTPYILHPLEAAVIVSTMTSDEDIISAAVLHDVVEDTPVTMAELTEKFGERVATLVSSETEDKREHLSPVDTWQIRKEESLEVLKNADNTDISILWLGDKLANMRSFYRQWKAEGDAIWQNFNQKDPSRQKWYYTSIAEYTSALKEHAAWKEYNELVKIIFGKVE